MSKSEFFVVALFIGFGFGWVINIVKIVTASESELMLIARAVGIIVPPLGGVLGYL